MPSIRPVSDLRNNFSDISKIVHETGEPIFLTKNGYGDMVIMSIDSYEKYLNDNELYLKLREAELEAELTEKRFSHEEVFGSLRETLKGLNSTNV